MRPSSNIINPLVAIHETAFLKFAINRNRNAPVRHTAYIYYFPSN